MFQDYSSCLSPICFNRASDTGFRYLICAEIEEKIQDYPYGPQVAAVEVLCVGVNESSERYKDLYHYEVIGGQHTARTKGRVV